MAAKRKRTRPKETAATLMHQRRIRVVYWLFLLGFGVVSWRLVGLHLAPNEKLIIEKSPYEAQVTIEVPRGKIVDRNDNVLARDRLAPSIWADPRKIADPQQAARRLAHALNVDETDVYNRLIQRTASDKLMQDVPIRRWLTEEEYEALGNLDDLIGPGLRVKREPMRSYPDGELAAHVLGYVNRERVGTEGIERRYDKYLHSVHGVVKARVDGKRKILGSLTEEYVPPEGGDDVYLTLDRAIQAALEDELRRAMEENEAERAMGLLMDPNTGGILALACLPAFDPNAYNKYDAELRKNRAMLDVFEPGSVFKAITAAAALEDLSYSPDALVDTEGGVAVFRGRRRIKDSHRHDEDPYIPFSLAFAESSNIVMIKLAQELGPDMLDVWIRRFGFGRETSRDFSNESRGIYRNRSVWSEDSIISLPIGQEVAVTMPQLARAYAAVANGGILVEPHVVDRVVGRNGRVLYRFEPDGQPRVMSRETAEVLKGLCYEVVRQPTGTGRHARIADYRAGGKTGTAQIADLENGGYYKDRWTSVFVGFAPISDPRVVAVIVVHNPKKQHYGGAVCGPVFSRVVREALIRLHVPDDPMPESELGGQVVAETAPDPDILVARLEEELLESTLQDHLFEQDVMELEALTEDLVEVSGGLPNLKGLTKRQARDELARIGVDWDSQGSGWVVAQEPPPGTALRDVSRCRLVFSSK